MGLNLHQMVQNVIGVVSNPIQVTIQASLGYTTNANGTRTAQYADPVITLADVQPLSTRDLRQVEGLNLQGTTKSIYINGQVKGIVRSTGQGGDLITMPDGSVWLVTVVLENWFNNGWCKAVITLQDGS